MMSRLLLEILSTKFFFLSLPTNKMAFTKIVIFAFLLFNLCFIALGQEGQDAAVTTEEVVLSKDIFLHTSPDADTTFIFPDESGNLELNN